MLKTQLGRRLDVPRRGGFRGGWGRYGRAWDKANARKKEPYLAWWTKELGLTTLGDIDLPRFEKNHPAPAGLRAGPQERGLEG